MERRKSKQTFGVHKVKGHATKPHPEIQRTPAVSAKEAVKALLRMTRVMILARNQLPKKERSKAAYRR